ncbi:hypothetical protein LZZ90_12860 [Flavobacterium sp. SM15]|uniref:hypothetical protein n=1 Tax=Flavobacterium sp. SM15 TaxID=2908005 RepID=UPI001EDA0D14|nr:hypothetical protein [Flavobacterium sp. SM15]MCG2612398.1 hypothetical protein [Flavobacterium sp. SM15]
MKSSITYLGIALVAFTSFASALNCQQSFIKEEIRSTEVQSSNEIGVVKSNENHSLVKKCGHGGRKMTVENAQGIDFQPYEKTIEEVIAENNQITENAVLEEVNSTYNNQQTVKSISEADQIINNINSMKGCAFLSERTMEEIILENNKIIENTIVKDAFFPKMGKSENQF